MITFLVLTTIIITFLGIFGVFLHIARVLINR